MPTLRLHQQGPLARLFNRFLAEHEFPAGRADVFDQQSREGTRQLQQWLIAQDPARRSKRIQVDGIPGNQTFGYSCAIARDDSFTPQAIAEAVDAPYPERLAALALAPTRPAQEALFGQIAYQVTPDPWDPERITITNDFVERHIVTVLVPQLAGRVGAPSNGKVRAHRLISAQLQGLWAAWEAAGLLELITDYGGLWVPRLVRGSKTALSNHAWGTAFDINVSANWLWHLPAFPGENGSLFEHVPIAQAYGFSWGGFYPGRLDGMHFEAVRVLSPAELLAVNTRYRVM